MAMKRTSLMLDAQDLHTLEKLGKIEAAATGSRCSASAIVRRLIRAYVLSQKERRPMRPDRNKE